MLQIKYLFPEFYTEERIEVDNAKLEAFCYHQKSIDQGITLTNVGSWHSEFLDPWKPDLFSLTEIVEQKISEVSYMMDFGTRATIDKCFINISNKSNSHKLHDHPRSLLSAVYYVNVGVGRGDLVFHSDNRLKEWCQRPDKIREYNQFNSTTWTVPASTGTLVIFPAWLKHEVTPNTTEKDRISIVYNCPIE
jgi:uncharacterized protein (TIGR02466 family)